MKLLKKSAKPSGQSGNKKGVALVTVLAVMSLSTILVLTFFSLAQSEHRASATYSHGLQAQQVGEQAINMVIAQIRKASNSTTSAWASQPGAIRTWSSNGDFETGYKLYSDEAMEVTDEALLVQEDFTEAANWSDQPEVYVDLNEPVVRGTKVYFPIVDPYSREIPVWPREIGNQKQGIEGFDYNTGKGGNSNSRLLALETKNGTPASELAKVVSDQTQREVLPMPVKWIYQLKDGTLGHLPPSGALDAPKQFTRLSGKGIPSDENRIVARFAFWADDETSKLNVNTAAGGLAWDIPKAGGDLDMAMGKFQPAQHEWQRYPGHPATTHLIPVLAPGVIDIVNDRDAMEMIFELVPRVVGGGSESGTVKIDPRDVDKRLGLIADKNPLFPSVDEFMLRPDREPAIFPDSKGGILPENEIQEHLERSKFFLTVTSRSPETTIFNTPRVTMWPIYNAARSTSSSSEYQTKLTNFDRLIHFCSTLGGEVSAGSGSSDRIDYIFRRENADSPTFDYTGIQRNQDLYKYLDGLMSENVPGYGDSFQSKYGKHQSRQILTQIFDYIRCTNLHDDSLFGEDWESAMTAVNDNKHITYTNGRRDRRNKLVVGEDRMHKSHGQVTPISIDLGSTPTKGFGRFFTLLDAEIVAINCGQANGETVGGVGANPRYPGITKYGGGWHDEPINEPAWSNIPPLNARVNVQYNSLDEAAKTAERTNWPTWLTMAYNANPADPLIAGSAPGKGGVFDPAVWNWQLGWVAGGYDNSKMGDRGPVNSDQMRLKEGETLIQAGLFFHLFTPSLGWIPINPDMSIEVKVLSGITFKSKAGATSLERTDYTWHTNGRQIGWGDRHYGGTKPLSYQLGGARPHTGAQNVSYGGRWTPIDPGYDGQQPYNQYDLITKPFVIEGLELSMTGGDVQFIFKDANVGDNQDSAPQDSAADVIQDITVRFDDFTVAAPILPQGRAGYFNEFNRIQRYPTSPLGMWSLTRHGTNPETVGGEVSNDRSSARRGRIYRINSHEGAGRIIWGQDVVQSVSVNHGDARIAAARAKIEAGEDIFGPHWMYGKSRMAHSMGLSTGGTYSGYQFKQDRQLVQDVNYRGKNPIMITGAESGYKTSDVMNYGDFDNGPGLTVDGPYINKPDEGNLHSLFNQTDPDASAGQFEMRRDYGDFPYFVRDWIHEPASPAYFSPNRIINGPGMFGSLPTGTIENRPWQTLLFRPNIESTAHGYKTHPGDVSPPDHLIMDLFWMPIVEPYAISEPLSTAGKVNLNYQMLPFRHIERSTALRGVFKSEFMLCVPTRGSGTSSRSRYVRDYKHNSGRGQGYHWRDKPYGGNLQGLRLRTVILEDQTLAQFQRKFETDLEIFKTGSEVTTMHLVPQQVAERQGSTSRRAQINTYTPDESNGVIADMDSGKYWAEHAVVGDNSRERPYGNIYNRVTTKSNSYKVHFRAQVLTQSRRADDDYSSWDPKIDSVVGEYRGATIVERYVESNDRQIPDYAIADPTQLPSLGEYYKFRVVNPTRFAP